MEIWERDEERAGSLGEVSPELMRSAFRHLVSGVVVVTCWVDDRPWGLTINSCSSISVEPSRVVVSLQTHTRTCEAVLAEQGFGLAMLGAHQREVAELAATPGQPKFIDDFCEPREEHRAPVIRHAIWHLQCDIHRLVEVGDHCLIIADVTALAAAGHGDEESHDEPQPLLYFNRKYRLIGGHP